MKCLSESEMVKVWYKFFGSNGSHSCNLKPDIFPLVGDAGGFPLQRQDIEEFFSVSGRDASGLVIASLNATKVAPRINLRPLQGRRFFILIIKSLNTSYSTGGMPMDNTGWWLRTKTAYTF